jgi:hypothetical protein
VQVALLSDGVRLTRQSTFPLYEHARHEPSLFLVAIDHADPEIEDVIDAEPGYLLVRKKQAPSRAE